MKFGALLRSSAQVMPELQGLFNCYKQLKKRLKRLPERGEAPVAAESLLRGSNAVKAHERAFVALLVSDIQAFNETFVEREEQSVIKLSLIEQRQSADLRPREIAALYKVLPLKRTALLSHRLFTKTFSTKNVKNPINGAFTEPNSDLCAELCGFPRSDPYACTLEHPSLHKRAEDPEEAPQAHRLASPGIQSATAPFSAFLLGRSRLVIHLDM